MMLRWRCEMRRMWTSVPSVIVAVVLLHAAVSERTAAQAPASGAVTALTGARLIDGTGRAAITQGTIVIRDGSISAVGPANSVTIPAGATRVDMAGKTI